MEMSLDNSDPFPTPAMYCRQKVHNFAMECFCWEQNNVYHLHYAQSNKEFQPEPVYVVKEEASWFCRACCGPSRKTEI